MRGGLRDIERGARLLYMIHAADTCAVVAPSAASVFRAAGEHGLIPNDAAGRLAEAASLWRNLRGILRLAAEDGFALDTADPRVGTVIARACGVDDVDALTAAVRETAARTAADIDALTA